MASDGVYDGVVDSGNGSNNNVIVPEGNAPSSFCPGYDFPSQPAMHSANMNTEDMSIEEIDCSDGNTQPQQQQQLFLPPCTAMSNEEEEDEEGTPRRLQVDPAVLRELQESRTRNNNNNVYGIDPATAALARHCHRGLFADQYCYPTTPGSSNNNAWASGAANALRPPSPRTLQRLLAHAAATGQPIDWSIANPLNNTINSQSIPLALTWYPEIPAGATAHPERKRPERSEASETTSSGPGEALGQSSLLSPSSTMLPPACELQASGEAGGAIVGGNGAAPAWSFPRIKRARQEEPQKELFSEEHYYYQGQYYSHDRDKAGLATSAAALIPPAPCENMEVRAADGGGVSPTLQKRRANVAKRARDGMTMNGAAAEDEDVAQRHRRTEDLL